MPYKRPNSPNWYISYSDPATGKQCRRPAGTDFKAAKALEQRLRAESHQLRAERSAGITVDAILAAYLEPRLNPVNRSTVQHLAPLFGVWCSELTPALVRAHIKDRQASGAAPATINKELVMLSAAINEYNADNDTHLPNPVTGLKLKEPDGKIRWLTRDEYAALIDHCEGHLLDFVEIGINTGMRKSEILNLRWERIDFPNALITLESGDTKSRKRRTIPINASCMTALKRRAESCKNAWVFCGQCDEPITDVKKSFATACKRANLKDVSPHTLRHTFASWLVIAGVPLYEVKDLLGHSTIKLTERYAHLAPENLRSAVDMLCDKLCDTEKSHPHGARVSEGRK